MRFWPGALETNFLQSFTWDASFQFFGLLPSALAEANSLRLWRIAGLRLSAERRGTKECPFESRQAGTGDMAGRNWDLAIEHLLRASKDQDTICEYRREQGNQAMTICYKVAMRLAFANQTETK